MVSSKSFALAAASSLAVLPGALANIYNITAPPTAIPGADIEVTLVPRLIHAALYELGTTMQIAHEAIGQAFDAKPRATTLGIEHFKLAYRARTGCSDAANPFVVPNWRKVDCTLILQATGDAFPAARRAKVLR